jgi:UDP-MurNAc hydroxylase
MNSSKVKFLNHSSLIIETNEIKILCDPWFKGTAFQDGWSLLFENSHNINNLDFDYIWISHEHPDHFSIPTLKDLHKKTKFLYQETLDKKVKNFLESKGHQVIELPHNQKVTINDLEIVSFISDGYDSSILLLFENGHSFLNVNDARVDLNNYLEKEILPHLNNRKLDMVSFQFSYANWAGNPGDKKISIDQQKLVDKKNKYILNTLKPKSCLLFASYVFFSHEENFYWNDNHYINHAYETLKNLKEDVIPIVPTPNEEFNLSRELDKRQTHLNSKKSIEYWTNLHDSVEIKNKTKTISNISDLEQSYYSFYESLLTKNTLPKNLQKNKNEFSLKVLVSDLQKVFEIYLSSRRFMELGPEDSYDISVSSETFIFLMKNKFARGTISINSRITFNYLTAFKFFTFFFIPYANNIGVYFDDLNPINPSKLKSIKNTSVMLSIFKFYSEAETNFDNLLESFK